MAVPASPLRLGDIFDQIFKLLGRTFVRNLIIALILLVPAAVILGVALQSFFSHLAELVQADQPGAGVASAQLMQFFSRMSLFGVGVTLFALATLAAKVGVAYVACAEMHEQPLTWQDGLAMSFSVRALRFVGQTILMYLAYAAVWGLAFVVFAAAVAQRDSGLLLLGMFAFMVGGVAFAFLWVKWGFVLPPLAWEGTGVFEAFGRSWKLVQGVWWRTFGILLLLNLIAQFALSIITTPVSMFALWDFFAELFQMMGPEGAEPETAVVLRTMQDFGLRLGLINCVSTVLWVLVSPLITVVMYFDLRLRQGEFRTPAAPAL